MNIQVVTSPGGIVAWLVEDHSTPLLSLHFAFDGGSTQDDLHKEGTANFLCNMLGEGAGEFGATAFHARAQDLALRLSFGAGKDAIAGSVGLLTETRAEGIELLKLVLTSPRFDAEALERIRHQLRVAVARSSSNPNQVAHRAWHAETFAGHPYARTGLGTEASLAKIQADDLEAYRCRVLARDTLKVVAAGDIDADQLCVLLDDVFGDLPHQSRLVPVAPVGRLPAGRLSVVDMDVPQSVVMFGMPGISQHDPDFAALMVLNYIVGGGSFSSRLMQEVRVKRGLAYHVSTQLVTERYAAVVSGNVATRNELVGQSIDVILAELARIADGDIREAEFDAAKSYLIGSWPLRFDSNAKIASQLLNISRDAHRPDYVNTRNSLIGAVLLDDVKRVAKWLFDPSGFLITVVGKPQLPQHLLKGLPRYDEREAYPSRVGSGQ